MYKTTHQDVDQKNTQVREDKRNVDRDSRVEKEENISRGEKHSEKTGSTRNAGVDREIQNDPSQNPARNIPIGDPQLGQKEGMKMPKKDESLSKKNRDKSGIPDGTSFKSNK